MFEPRFSFADFSDQDDSPVVGSYRYEPYDTSERQPAACPRRFNVDELEGEAYQFQGHREEIDLHRQESALSTVPSFLNFQFRAFHPKSAPWSAVDPAGYVDGMNAYVFSRDEPMHRVEPV